MSEINLNLAGLRFRFFGQTETTRFALHPEYAAFTTGGNDAPLAGDYEIVDTEDQITAPHASPLWASFMWRLAVAGGARLLIEARDLRHDRYLKVALVSADFGTGRILARSRPPQPVYAVNYPEEQVIFLNRFSFFDAGLVHSSGIVADGKAYLFCGRSGAGKTTSARLWKTAGFRLLNDDRMVVRVIDGQPYACATPWHSDDPEVNAESYPLGAVFHLNKARENRLVPIPGAQAVARLYATSLSPFYSRAGTSRVIDAYTRALDVVPSFDLHFTPDQRPVELCLREVVRRD